MLTTGADAAEACTEVAGTDWVFSTGGLPTGACAGCVLMVASNTSATLVRGGSSTGDKVAGASTTAAGAAGVSTRGGSGAGASTAVPGTGWVSATGALATGTCI